MYDTLQGSHESNGYESRNKLESKRWIKRREQEVDKREQEVDKREEQEVDKRVEQEVDKLVENEVHKKGVQDWGA